MHTGILEQQGLKAANPYPPTRRYIDVELYNPAKHLIGSQMT